MGLNFKHSGAAGDVLFSLWTIQDMNKRYANNEPANLYLECGVRADYYPGHAHPAGNSRLSRALAKSLTPLLESQPYFNEVAIYEGQKIDVDLDLFRCLQIDYTKSHLATCYFWAFAAHADLSQPCLHVEPDEKFHNRLVVNRTSRYRNPRINYKFLDPYQPVFLGLPDEFEDFQKECPSAEYHPTKNHLEVARILRACKLLVANQSSVYAVAECLKTPRVLEISLIAPNVLPHGPAGRSAVTQTGFEWQVIDMA